MTLTLDSILDKLNDVGYETREQLVADLETVFKDKALRDIGDTLSIMQFRSERQIQDALAAGDWNGVLECIGVYNGIEMTLAVIQNRPTRFKTRHNIKKEPLH